MANRKTQRRWAGTLLLAGLGLLLSRPMAPAAPAQNKAKTETLTGNLGDTMCGRKHMRDDARECIALCLRTMGAQYALVTSAKIYTLEGKEAEIDKLLRQKQESHHADCHECEGAEAMEKRIGPSITVTGVVQGDTIQVTSVSVPPKHEEAPHYD